jgi:hemerythrin superfamily protein
MSNKNKIEKGIEAIASEVMGAIKATKGKLSGLQGVFEHLAREHGKATGLLLRLKVSSDPRLRASLFSQVRRELLAHERGELAVVFPAFRSHRELAGFVEEHRRDAEKLDSLIEGLSTTPCTDEMWGPRLDDLIQSVSQHAAEEEEEFFPKASHVLGSKKSDALLERFEAAKAKIEKGLKHSAASAPKATRKTGNITARAERPAARVARGQTGKPGSATRPVRSGGGKQRKSKAASKTEKGTARRPSKHR